MGLVRAPPHLVTPFLETFPFIFFTLFPLCLMHLMIRVMRLNFMEKVERLGKTLVKAIVGCSMGVWWTHPVRGFKTELGRFSELLSV